MSRNLPEFPNLDYLKKRAKILLRELQQRSPGAKLTQAQHAIAREYGFASWPKLKAHVASLPHRTTTSPLSDATPPQGSRGGRGATSEPVDHQDDSGGGTDLFPRFTEKARRTIFFARYFAQHENRRIEVEHLFLGVVQADQQLMNRLLTGHFQARPAPEPTEMARMKASLAERIPKLLQQIGRPMTAGVTLSATGYSPLSSECRRVLEHASKEAERLRHQKISTGHFLLAFLCEEVEQTTRILNDILKENKIPIETARDGIARFLSEELM